MDLVLRDSVKCALQKIVQSHTGGPITPAYLQERMRKRGFDLELINKYREEINELFVRCLADQTKLNLSIGKPETPDKRYSIALPSLSHTQGLSSRNDQSFEATANVNLEAKVEDGSIWLPTNSQAPVTFRLGLSEENYIGDHIISRHKSELGPQAERGRIRLVCRPESQARTYVIECIIQPSAIFDILLGTKWKEEKPYHRERSSRRNMRDVRQYCKEISGKSGKEDKKQQNEVSLRQRRDTNESYLNNKPSLPQRKDSRLDQEASSSNSRGGKHKVEIHHEQSSSRSGKDSTANRLKVGKSTQSTLRGGRTYAPDSSLPPHQDPEAFGKFVATAWDEWCMRSRSIPTRESPSIRQRESSKDPRTEAQPTKRGKARMPSTAPKDVARTSDESVAGSQGWDREGYQGDESDFSDITTPESSSGVDVVGKKKSNFSASMELLIEKCLSSSLG